MSFYLLYLHGFNGSPYGHNATRLFEWFKTVFPGIHIQAPHLEYHRISVIETISEMLDSAQFQYKVIFGNSMGGLIAHILKQSRTDIHETILLNPALNFGKIMAGFPKEHISSKSGQPVSISDETITAVERMMPRQPENQQEYLLLLQRDDDICPYQDTVAMLPGARQDIQSGQGHYYEDITQTFPEIERFLCHLKI